MKKLAIILLLSLAIKSYSQVTMDYVIGSHYTTIAEFKTKIGAKIVAKRFYYAGIYKKIEKQEKYFIELETDDQLEYFQIWKFKNPKIKCLPKRIRKKLIISEYETI